MITEFKASSNKPVASFVRITLLEKVIDLTVELNDTINCSNDNVFQVFTNKTGGCHDLTKFPTWNVADTKCRVDYHCGYWPCDVYFVFGTQFSYSISEMWYD